MIADAAIEHPYVAVINKKLRNLNKRLRGITQIESLAATGQVLERSQLEALSAKGQTEALIENLLSVRTSMLDLGAIDDASANKGEQPQQQEVASKEKEVSESLEKLVIASSSSSEQEPASATVVIEEKNAANVEPNLRMFMLCLRVGANYTNATGKPLPPAVAYFYSIVLGQASVSGFNEALEQSLKSAGLFMWVSHVSLSSSSSSSSSSTTATATDSSLRPASYPLVGKLKLLGALFFAVQFLHRS